MRAYIIIVASAGIVLSAVAVHAAGKAAPLAGTSWRPVPLSGMAGTDERPVHVAFQSAEKVSGFSGCNRFFGSYQQNGDRLLFGPLATTRMACAPDVMAREARFLELLKRVRLITTGHEELALKTWEGAVFLRLVPHD